MPWTSGRFGAEHLLRGALWLLLLSVVATTRTDPDLWGHVRFGQDMISARSVRLADTYSFTSDRPWVNHEWGAEVAFGAAFNAGGGAGLIGLKLLSVLTILLLLSGALRADGLRLARRRDLLVAVAVIATIQQAHHIRPQLFSLLFFSMLIGCLLAARRAPVWLWVVPPLFGAWVNFHGGWIVGGGVLALWTAGLAMSRDPGAPGAVPNAAAGAAALAATVLNPIGIGMHRFLFETVGLGRADITEWQPVYAMSPSIWGLWIVVALLAAVGGVRAWRRGAPIERLIVVAALAMASFRVNRLLAFFALATLFLVGAALAAPGLPRPGAVSAGRPRTAAMITLAITTALILVALRGLAANARCVRIDPRTTPEPEALTVFRDRGAHGRLLVWFDWGEFALWHLSPALRVSIDGRRETVYSSALQDRHLRFFFDAAGGAALPEALAADYIWIPKELPAAPRLAAAGWTLQYEGPRSVIFARTAVPAVIRPPASSEPGCFPGS